MKRTLLELRPFPIPIFKGNIKRQEKTLRKTEIDFNKKNQKPY